MPKPPRAPWWRRSLARATPYGYLSPALLTITFFTVVPMVWTIYLAFTNYSLYNFKQYDLIGFRNFVEILAGPTGAVFWPVFAWTTIYAAGTVLVSFAIGLFLALLLHNPDMRETNLYRGILIIPWALPAAIAVLSWAGLLNEGYGPLNQLLVSLGLEPRPWLSNPTYARMSILAVNFWLAYPFMMSACLGGLQAIPQDLYEAAEIDGANWWQRFWHITLPALTRFSIPLVVSSFAFNFNNFGPAFLITGGGPPRVGNVTAGSTDILVSVVYKLTINQYRYGLASAMSILLFLIIGGLSLMNFKLTGAFEEKD